MEDKSHKQPVKDHHDFFTVVFDDKSGHKELEDQHKNEQNNSEE